MSPQEEGLAEPFISPRVYSKLTGLILSTSLHSCSGVDVCVVTVLKHKDFLIYWYL